MLNRNPWWKDAAILFIIVVAFFYALPNLYGEDPALQLSPTNSQEVSASLVSKIGAALDGAGLSHFGLERSARQVMVRFPDAQTQLKAQTLLQAEFGERHTVALNLAPATPGWLKALSANPMKLGLDLRGGVHFLLEVDVEEALKKRYESYEAEIKQELKDEGLKFGVVRGRDDGIDIKFRTESQRDAALRFARRQWRDLAWESVMLGRHFGLQAGFTEQAQQQVFDYAVNQNVDTLRKRVNELGVAEPLVQRHGKSRIVVQLPGVQDTAQAKSIIGKTATLEFHMVDGAHDVQSALQGGAPLGSKVYYNRDKNPVLLKRLVMLTGENINNAQSGFDENNLPAVHINLDDKGAKKFYKYTKANVGRPMAVVFIEQKVKVSKSGKKRKVLEEQVINVATIQSALAHRFQITGLDSSYEASDLALLLRAGSLAAPVTIVEERTVGPSMGQDNIDKGKLSILIGFILVLLFMVFYYKVFGLFANVALCLNLVIIIAVLSLIPGATLTFPGIAGIVLTVGMAVDANVLIFQRIREELTRGVSIQEAIDAGYAKAFGTIADANITTFVVAMVLFAVGTGPVRGFAVTLSIGLLTSMFTAIVVTRALVNRVYGGRKVQRLAV